MSRKFTYAIQLDVGNAEEIAEFEDISLGSVTNMIARDVRSVAHVALDHFVLFGYITTSGHIHNDWAIVNRNQLEENFKEIPAEISHKVVRVFYK